MTDYNCCRWLPINHRDKSHQSRFRFIVIHRCEISGHETEGLLLSLLSQGRWPYRTTLTVLCSSEALGGGYSLVSLLGVSWFVRWSLSSPACWWFCWLLRGDCPGCLLQYRPHCVPALWGRWPDGLGVRIRLLRCQCAWVSAYSSHFNLSCQPLFLA